MQPVRRDMNFDFPADRIGDWHGDGVGSSQFINALSVIFPEGERFFIDAVRHYRKRIKDPELQQAVTAFIGQEAMHGREHERWNQAYFAAVPGARRIEAFATRRLKRWQKWLPKSTQLAMTIGAEHLTAVIGNLVLSRPEFLQGHGENQSHPVYVAMLQWHAMEETEHKAVAFDVWKTVMRYKPRAYAERCFGLLFMLAAYWPVVNRLVVEGIKAQTRGNEQEIREAVATINNYLYGRNGLIRSLALPFLSYFRPGFHPWDKDNRELLAQMGSIEARYTG